MSTLYNKAVSILNEKEAKIIPENIKDNVEVYDVIGNLQPLSLTSDADATSSDLINGKTAYVNSQKITGSYVPVISNEDYQTCLGLTQNILGI